MEDEGENNFLIGRCCVYCGSPSYDSESRPTQSSSSNPLLVSRNQAIRRSKLGVRTSKRLSTSTNRNKVLAVLESLTLNQISKEIHQITTETSNIGSVGSEGVNLIDTIASIPQLPAVASNSDCSNGLAGLRDGAGATEGGQPDHDFEFVLAACGGRGEDVVGDVGDDVAAGLYPGPFGGEGLDLGDLDGVGLCDDVGVGFYLAGAAGP